MPGAYYGLAITNDFEGGDTNYSIENYKRAIDLDHTYDRAHYYLAHAYDKLGESKLAIEEFKKLLTWMNLILWPTTTWDLSMKS